MLTECKYRVTLKDVYNRRLSNRLQYMILYNRSSVSKLGTDDKIYYLGGGVKEFSKEIRRLVLLTNFKYHSPNCLFKHLTHTPRLKSSPLRSKSKKGI